MKPIASRILALEPEPERGRRLEELIRERVDAEVIVARSWDDAAAAMASHLPDVILISSLSPPADEAKLLQHLRELDTDRDPAILFVPPVVDEQRSAADSGWRFSLTAWRSRARARWPPYDVDAIGSRINEALTQPRRVRSGRIRFLNDTRGSDRQASGAVLTSKATLPVQTTRRSQIHRAWRWTPAELPWMCSIHTRWGIDASVVNVSRSGVLIESQSRLAPESSIELHVRGRATTLDVPARVIRSEVSAIDLRGVKYRSAAIFDAALQLLSAEPGPAPHPSKTVPFPESTSLAVIDASTTDSLNNW
jgi:CheY-like chemotaxis protein